MRMVTIVLWKNYTGNLQIGDEYILLIIYV